jgi:hypothetical protein
MRLASTAITVCIAIALLTGCSGGIPSSAISSVPSIAGGATSSSMHHGAPVSIIPRSDLPKGPVNLHGRRAPTAAIKGIYVGNFLASTINGYMKNNSGNNPAICQITGVSNVNNIATDTVGNLIVPVAFNGVNVYTGPSMCGPLMATIADSYGQASDAAAVNAATGNIVVANILGPGFVVVCAVSSLSCTQLTPSSAGIGEVAGVAMDAAGNCYADSYNAAFTAVELTYWAGCGGTGTALSGFLNTGYGGVDIDNMGNIATLNWHGTAGTDLWVYSLSGTSLTSVSDNPLTNDTAIFGHIGKQGQRLVVGAYAFSQVSIYAYTPTTLTYYYSFNNGLGSGDIEGVAYSPSSKK